MRLQLRPALALLAVVVLNLGIHDTFGFWSLSAFVLTLLALALAFVACVVPDRLLNVVTLRQGGRRQFVSSAVSPTPPSPDGTVDGTGLLLLVTALLLTGININSTEITYSEVAWARRALVFLAVGGFCVTLLVAARCARALLYPGIVRGDAPALAFLGVVALIIGLCLRGLVVIASPDPVIDVYAMLRDYGDDIVRGKNIYQSDIVSPYETERAARYGVIDPCDPRPAGYPPLPYVAAAPFRAFNLDPRWANVLGDALAVIALFGVGARRGRAEFGLLAAATWLFVPRIAFIIEQAWYEPMLAGLFGVGLWWTELAGWRKRVGYILLGLALTAKQFGVALLPALAWPHRQNWKLVLLGLLAGGLLILPWFVWSPSDFVNVVVSKHLERGPQYRSLTVGSAVYHLLDREIDREWTWAAAGALILAVSWRSPRHGAATAVGLGTALGIFCVFHTQGYPNYFYLVQYLWLLGCVGLAPTAQSLQLESSPE